MNHTLPTLFAAAVKTITDAGIEITAKTPADWEYARKRKQPIIVLVGATWELRFDSGYQQYVIGTQKFRDLDAAVQYIVATYAPPPSP